MRSSAPVLDPQEGQFEDVLLVLHGNRQTGDLLLGRLTKLIKRLLNDDPSMFVMAPDAPWNADAGADESRPSSNNNSHDEDEVHLTWWHRGADGEYAYRGLEESLVFLFDFQKSIETNQISAELQQQQQEQKKKKRIVGVLGFSQGARLLHLLLLLRQEQLQQIIGKANNYDKESLWFPHLTFAILVSGYDAPIPDQILKKYIWPSSTAESTSTVKNIMEKDNKTGSLLTTPTAFADLTIDLPSLHVYGQKDTLIPPSQSKALLKYYSTKSSTTQIYSHPGTHFVPCKTKDVQVYLDFITNAMTLLRNRQQNIGTQPLLEETLVSQEGVVGEVETSMVKPDEENAILQIEEVQALQAIFPEEFELLSEGTHHLDQEEEDDDDDNYKQYEFPIKYQLRIIPLANDNNDQEHECFILQVQYPHDYPLIGIPEFSFLPRQQQQQHHDHTQKSTKKMSSSYFEHRTMKMIKLLQSTSQQEIGMPHILSAVYAIKEYLEEENEEFDFQMDATEEEEERHEIEEQNEQQQEDVEDTNNPFSLAGIERSTPEQIRLCHEEGLEVAATILLKQQQQQLQKPYTHSSKSIRHGGSKGAGNTTEFLSHSNSSNNNSSSSWNYVIGLVGKPSAGKSTFFNAATAFSRQRGAALSATISDTNEDRDRYQSKAAATNFHNSRDTVEDNTTIMLGGASMAAHPFTTIDPNIGYCLIPAPLGSCPEDELFERRSSTTNEYGSTHGRSPEGRRFLPVLLKDVAGLVPGAYQGKGRGNQFLSDLTDATSLIHVVDASGTADAQGNPIVMIFSDDSAEENILRPKMYQNQNSETNAEDNETTVLTNPIDDLIWIRNELVEWILTNLLAKWDGIQRRGLDRLGKMFSGYGQREVETRAILLELESYMGKHYHRDDIYSKQSISTWDEGDVHRLVSAFLGVRFPMVLALNKCDIPTSKAYIDEIQKALPIHGIHKSTPMVARNEMTFVKDCCTNIIPDVSMSKSLQSPSPPIGVWNCLTSALSLREPILVFPVSDMTSYAPLPGLNKIAAEMASLPSMGMIRCIKESQGTLPSCWDDEGGNYVVPSNSNSAKHGSYMAHQKLRDVLVMRPGTTVEDVFLVLKKLGALGGEFVRAEAVGDIGEKQKPIPKHELIGRHNRIIKVMSNKRASWQK